MKNVKKNTKPTIIVDLTKVESCEDIRFEFIRAKAKAGVALTESEINQVIAYGAHLTLDAIDSLCNQFASDIVRVKITDKKQIKQLKKMVKSVVEPKTPWYKKVWNWIKSPFVKK